MKRELARCAIAVRAGEPIEANLSHAIVDEQRERDRHAARARGAVDPNVAEVAGRIERFDRRLDLARRKRLSNLLRDVLLQQRRIESRVGSEVDGGDRRRSGRRSDRLVALHGRRRGCGRLLVSGEHRDRRLSTPSPRPMAFVTPPIPRFGLVFLDHFVARELHDPLRIYLPIDDDLPLVIECVVNHERGEFRRQTLFEAHFRAWIGVQLSRIVRERIDEGQHARAEQLGSGLIQQRL